MSRDPLLKDLRTLARTVAGDGIVLTVGGGYGLVLRARLVAERGSPTLSEMRLNARSTADIDCFLSAEVITDAAKTRALRSAIDALGYAPKAEFFQFTRSVDVHGSSREIGLDLLTGPLPVALRDRAVIKRPRVRPKGSSGLHAFLTEEAFAVETGAHRLDIGDGPDVVIVQIPHPFMFLLLKLFALRDRMAKADGATQKYHALDLLTLWAGMSEAEYEEAREMSRDHASHDALRQGREIIASLFSDGNAVGAVALAQQADALGARMTRNEVDRFVGDLRAMFDVGGA